MTRAGEAVQRADAQRNRERILKAAVVELARDADVSLSAIGKRAGVGQGTLYRHFPDREALLWAVHQREVEGLVGSAHELTEATEPDRALRAWMSQLARFALTKAGLGGVTRQTDGAEDTSARPGYALVIGAIETLLAANRRAGTIRPDITVEDFVILVSGLWQIAPDERWEARAERLLDLVMAALQAGPRALR
ncbi:TetR/AcrR family transcriptional regulator [Marinactinospora thermotolerans]|uniref:Transcriptional regulator, TetR family n=1 Tax=Marinactinospora thermotolerans DSM 45154 TaxID=1122192 RepID=A0A1T4PFQ5_9ACTN|nr:TetR/AcrR family transcriptional regulator [Marinactinospora thermotolerans]SJZ90056.1 transcriptional regulator, TetR family [Marinactinospora thermotolerans DSM 45154]